MCSLHVKHKERLNHHIEKITNHDQTHSIHWHCHIESNVVSLFLTTQWFLVYLCRHVNWCLSSILKWHSEPQQRHWIITLKWLQTNEETHFVCWHDHWWSIVVFDASFNSMCFVLCLHRHEDQCSFDILKMKSQNATKRLNHCIQTTMCYQMNTLHLLVSACPHWVKCGA